MSLFIPDLQLLFCVHPDCRLKLCLLQRVLERQVIVLTDERENHGREISFERQPWHKSLVDWLVSGQQDAECDLEPWTLRPLSRVIQARQLRSLENTAQPRFGNEFDQADALNAPRVLAREAIERRLNLFNGVLGKFPLYLVLNFNWQA